MDDDSKFMTTAGPSASRKLRRRANGPDISSLVDSYSRQAGATGGGGGSRKRQQPVPILNLSLKDQEIMDDMMMFSRLSIPRTKTVAKRRAVR